MAEKQSAGEKGGNPLESSSSPVYGGLEGAPTPSNGAKLKDPLIPAEAGIQRT